MKILCVVQARMDSTRFPGKVLAELDGRAILTHVVSRCLASGLKTVVATTDREVDDPIALWGADFPADTVFRGDEWVDEVLQRYIDCAEAYDADAIVRVTGDSPLVPVEMINAVAGKLQRGEALAAFTRQFGAVPDGWEVEGCSTDWLRFLDITEPTASEREHVFPGIYKRAVANRSRLPGCKASKWNKPWMMALRFSVDTPEDLDWLRFLAEHLDFTPPRPDPGEIYDLLQQKPELCR